MWKSLSISSGDFFSYLGGLSAVTSNTTILPEVSFPYIIFIWFWLLEQKNKPTMSSGRCLSTSSLILLGTYIYNLLEFMLTLLLVSQISQLITQPGCNSASAYLEAGSFTHGKLSDQWIIFFNYSNSFFIFSRSGAVIVSSQ